MTSRKLIIGVDVGGTNTDAVLLDPTKSGPEAVIVSYKATTGADVTTGIEEAIRVLLKDADVSPASIVSLMIGTTHLINAVVERDASRLEPVAIVRLAANNYMKGTPPFIDFPSDLKRIMNGYQAMLAGGCQIDGSEIASVNEEEVRGLAKTIQDKGLRSVAITGIYSPMDETFRQEERVRDLLRPVLGDGVDIVCSKEIAGVGILARENATILNASILRFARRTINGFRRAMRNLLLTCPLYLTSSAGQLLSSQEAMKYPIRIFSSGPTNSIRGAAFLSAERHLSDSRFVVDIGGTTTDIGCLLPSGFPRMAGSTAEVGGVKVNFGMPQVESIGLGGGSLVHERPDGKVAIGPESVGQALRERARCFGGDVLTATDIAVAAGEASIGTTDGAAQLSSSLGETTVHAAQVRMQRMIEDHVDRMKTSPEPCKILLVGGGAFLCPRELQGVASIEVPQHAHVANAVGAAVAEIGEEAEAIVDAGDKQQALADVKAKVMAQAIQRGAKAADVRIVEEDVSGVPYMAGKFRIVVKVVGPVDYERFLEDAEAVAAGRDEEAPTDEEAYMEKKQWERSGTDEDVSVETEVDHTTYKPDVDEDRVWTISETDAHYLAIGCYILGCAGGGTPYGVYLSMREMLRSGGKIRIVDVDDLPDDGLCVPVAGVGSPVLAIERLGGNMVLDAARGLEKHLGVTFAAILTAEIGGSNGLGPMMLSSSRAFDVCCVDADLMGRAFPAFQMSSLYIGANGDINHLLPACLASGEGTTVTIDCAKDTKSVDEMMRAITVNMGMGSGIAARPAGKKELKEFGVLRSVSLAWRLGRAVCQARARGSITTVHKSLIREFGGPQAARKVFEGKITGIEQRLYGGRSHGTLVIEKLKDYEKEHDKSGDDDDYVASDEEDEPEHICIPFINENLILEATYPSGETKILATVPDLIMVLDILTGEAVGVPEYRYGLKVFVMVAACHSLWTSTENALKIAGPRAFGYDMDFKPSGKYAGVVSVIDQYGPAKKK